MFQIPLAKQNLTLKSLCIKNLVKISCDKKINIANFEIPLTLKYELFKNNSIKFYALDREDCCFYDEGFNSFVCPVCDHLCTEYKNILWVCDRKSCTFYRNIVAMEDFADETLYIQNANHPLFWLIEKQFFCFYCGRFEENQDNSYTLCTTVPNYNGNDDDDNVDFPKCTFIKI